MKNNKINTVEENKAKWRKTQYYTMRYKPSKQIKRANEQTSHTTNHETVFSKLK